MAYVRFMSSSELAAASVNSTITLWRWESMERLQAFSGHVNVSNFAGMATTGDYIACGSETSQVRTGQRQHACMSTSMYKHTNRVSADPLMEKMHQAERMRRGLISGSSSAMAVWRSLGRSQGSALQVHIYCKQLSRPILTHSLTPARMAASSSYCTLATVWRPHSPDLVVSLSTGSCYILSLCHASDN